MGLGPTLLEFREIVKDFLLANGLETVFNDGMPGYDWATAFMRRHNMTLKTGGMMQLARKSVTSDPFVIYGFYDILRQEMARLEIMERPECIWNLDETGFPLDPSKAKTIGTKGAKTVRVTSGSSRENISVLATCCADGTSLDPLIIFKGKNMQSSWVGTEALPETQYAVSESGWMTRVIFEDFFKRFVEKTKDIRPILLILDGHLSHTSLATVELAKQENISIIKLPAHCTDLLQPLDVACFAPLKSYYDSALMRYVHQTGARAPLQKRGFVNMLCQVWKEGLSQENIKAGFYATGIHPLNPEKYTTDRLCPLKMKTYKAWIERGSPRDDENNPVLHVATTDKTDNRDSQPSSQNPSQPSDASTTNVATSPIPEPEIEKGLSDTTPTPVQEQVLPGCSHWLETSPENKSELQDEIKKDIENRSALYAKHLSWRTLVNEIQARAPTGMKFNILLVEKEKETTLEEILHRRGRLGTTQAARRKINMHSQIITQEECQEKTTQLGTQKKGKCYKVQGKKRKEPEPLSDSTTEDEMEVMESDSADDVSFTFNEDESELEREEEIQAKKATPADTPIITDDAVGKYYAVYYTEPRVIYYWGKIVKTFADDDDSPVNKVEIDCLQKKNISSDPKEWTWTERNTKKDIDVVDKEYIFYGPVVPMIMKNIFRFPDEMAFACLKAIEKKIEGKYIDIS